MSLLSRIANVFRTDRLNREIDEELESHIDEAIEQGRDPAEARRAFGSALRLREESRDFRMTTWVDSLRADTIFGWRQLMHHKVTSAAAILSLALGIGACTAAFRLIDAVLLRPLPIAAPDRLYALSYDFSGDDGTRRNGDRFSYPQFRQMRAAVKGQAELLAIAPADRVDLTYGSDEQMEKAYQQYVSGWMFGSFGLRPALGRLLTENDDLHPGAHPYAVLSYDYWTRRFARDPNVIGRTFRWNSALYQIVGVAPERFTGTEPGSVTDIFVPMMMRAGAIGRSDYFWFGTFVCLGPGVSPGPVGDRLRPVFRASREERAKALVLPKERLDQFLNQTLLLEPAAAGVSAMQQDYRRSLAALGVLVFLVLLIACANVANLMTAQAAARAREMALRVSIGAGRWRLVQLVLVGSAWISFLAALIGAWFAWWSAPLVANMINPPGDPARLLLPVDWRVFGFGLALTTGVTFLFGLMPALRASAVQPVITLKGGADPHSRHRLMHSLIAVQVAFCFLVLFSGNMLVTTFVRLSNHPTGFSSERLLAVTTAADRPQPGALWEQIAQHLRTLPGVETVAISEWPLMQGGVWNGLVSIHGAPPSAVLSNFLNVSPGWMDAMRIPLLDGRDFRADDPNPGTAIVNRTFARQFFRGEDPVGKWFEQAAEEGTRTRFQIVGVAGDALYQHMRNPIEPTAYFPFSQSYIGGTFVVRTTGSHPLALASMLRREVPRARPGFRACDIQTQQELNQAQTVRERLVAMLALFFAGVALLLAGIGLYGVLDYLVLERRREIGIRIALGARPGFIVRLVTGEVFSRVLVGALAGLAFGLLFVRSIESLFYQVKPTDLSVLAFPCLIILAAALLAALPAVFHAVRIDPVKMLRSE